MAENVILFGKSGSGKSRSLMNFKEDEIVLFNTIGKRLPFPKQFKYNQPVDDVEAIKKVLLKMPTKTAVIDDETYIMINMFMRNHGKGGDQFRLYNSIADSIWSLYDFIRNNVPQDVIVYHILHEDTNDYGEVKIRTIGKLLDSKVSIEGLVSIALRCVVKNGQHIFITQSDGADVAKSPEGMFDLEIPNDLKAVDSAIRKYWSL